MSQLKFHLSIFVKLSLLSLNHFVQESLSHGWVGKICITQSFVKNAASALLYVRSFHQLLEKDLDRHVGR